MEESRPRNAMPAQQGAGRGHPQSLHCGSAHTASARASCAETAARRGRRNKEKVNEQAAPNTGVHQQSHFKDQEPEQENITLIMANPYFPLEPSTELRAPSGEGDSFAPHSAPGSGHGPILQTRKLAETGRQFA